MLHRIISLIALSLLLAAGRAEADTLPIHYVAYAGGFRVLDIAGSIGLDARGYSIDLVTRTLGLYGLMVDGDSHSQARGSWQGSTAVPSFYDSRGRWDGQARATTIDYPDGEPSIRQLIPPNLREREPVPPALQANTVDTLSAMASLVRLVATTGRCEGETRIFDGRRLSRISVHTAGLVTLPRTDRSSFSGPTLRCDFEGQLLAGFKYGSDRARAARPQQGIAWLARLSPGGPLLPVRIQFAAPFFGAATMYMQR